jgi:hypothetical protein
MHLVSDYISQKNTYLVLIFYTLHAIIILWNKSPNFDSFLCGLQQSLTTETDSDSFQKKDRNCLNAFFQHQQKLHPEREKVMILNRKYRLIGLSHNTVNLTTWSIITRIRN